MPRFTTKRYEQILTEMIAGIVSRTKLSDLSDSSDFKHLLAAAAQQDEEQYYQMYLLLKLFDIDQASGDDLDARAAEIQPSELERIQSKKAVGTVVFYRDTVSGSITKPAGITVKTSSGAQFITTAGFTINAADPPVLPGHTTGQDSTPVPIQAIATGEDSNVAANTIIKFASKPTGLTGVTNPSVTLQGRAKETDDAFRKRIKVYVLSLCRSTPYALEGSVLNLEDPDTGAIILYAKAIEDIVNKGYTVLYIDDGTGYIQSSEVVLNENVTYGLAGPPANSAVGGETYLFLDYQAINDNEAFALVSSTRGVLGETTDYYLDPSRGQINFVTPLVTGEVITAAYYRFTGLIALAQKVVNGDPNDRENYPGFRGAGVQVKVQAPQLLIQNVEASLVISNGYDAATVKANVENAILKYINTLEISGDVIRTELIAAIQNVDGVYDLTLSDPATNRIVLDDQLIRTSLTNIDVN